MKWLTSGILFVVLITTAAAAPTPFAEDDPLRLPKSSIPISYDLSLTTNVHTGDRAFSGNVKIEIEVMQDTNVITLHNSGLTIESLKLFSSNGDEVETSFDEEKDKNFVHLRTSSRTLMVGEIFTVEGTFAGLLDTGTNGFYRSSYFVENETR